MLDKLTKPNTINKYGYVLEAWTPRHPPVHDMPLVGLIKYSTSNILIHHVGEFCYQFILSTVLGSYMERRKKHKANWQKNINIKKQNIIKVACSYTSILSS